MEQLNLYPTTSFSGDIIVDWDDIVRRFRGRKYDY